MTVRVFICDDCGHRMRVRGAHCGLCHQEKKLWQKPLTIVGFAALVLLAVLGGLVALVVSTL